MALISSALMLGTRKQINNNRRRGGMSA